MVRCEVIPHHPKYILTADGEVYRRIDTDKTKALPLKEDRSTGYSVVKLDGINEYVHVLVALLFCDSRRSEQTLVHHIDGNNFNNHAENLIWVSHSESQRLSRMNQWGKREFILSQVERNENEPNQNLQSGCISNPL